MPHWRTLRKPSETLRAYDLVDKNGHPKDFTVKIAKVTQGTVKSVDNPKGDQMPFAYFDGARKPIGLNVTNCKIIASIAGTDDYDKWVGISFTMYATKIKDKKTGEMVDAIRIRPRKPSSPAEIVPEQPIDEEMIAKQQAAFGLDPGKEG